MPLHLGKYKSALPCLPCPIGSALLGHTPETAAAVKRPQAWSRTGKECGWVALAVASRVSVEELCANTVGGTCPWNVVPRSMPRRILVCLCVQPIRSPGLDSVRNKYVQQCRSSYISGFACEVDVQCMRSSCASRPVFKQSLQI